MSPLAAPAQSPAAPPPEQAKLAAAAKQFEAIFVRQMLSAARKADFGEPLLGGQAMDTFRQMQDERFADIAAERGSFGIAKMLEAQLALKSSPAGGGGSPARADGGGTSNGQTPTGVRSAHATSPNRGGSKATGGAKINGL